MLSPIARAKNVAQGAMIVCGLFSGYAHMLAAEVRELDVRGIEAIAKVTGGSVGSKSGTTLNLAWTDSTGQARVAQSINISGDLAGQIVRNGQLQVSTLAVRYLLDDAKAKPQVARDMPIRLAANTMNRNVVGGLAAVCALAWLGLGLAGRRRRDVQTS